MKKSYKTLVINKILVFEVEFIKPAQVFSAIWFWW